MNNKQKKYHYTYLIINTNPDKEEKFYIGCHSTDIEPENDIQYMGSSYHLQYDIKHQDKNDFKKEIIKEWDTQDKAMLHESRLHKEFDVAHNPEYYNRLNSKKGFTRNSITE
jgi:hypothetical protein